MSSWTSAPPVSLPTRGDVVQAEVEELGEQRSDARQGQVGAGVHRVTTRPERQRRCHAPVIGGQVGDRPVPQQGVHHQPMREHDGGPSPVSW
jgi:hypothetical protein